MTSIPSTAGSAALAILSAIPRAGFGTDASRPATSAVSADSSGRSAGGIGNAVKSVGSAIFNAVADLAEKDETIKAIVKYIDDNYTNDDKRFANFYAEYGDEPAVAEHRRRMKEMGEELKQLVLSDPEGAKRKLAAITMGRPDLTREGALSILTLNLSESLAAKNPSAMSSAQDAPVDSAESAMDIIGRIQSAMRFYHTALASKAVADTTAMTEQAFLTHVTRYLAAGMDPAEASARYEAERAKGFELSDGAKLGDQPRQFIDGIAGQIRTLAEKLSKVATIEGDILARTGDGAYDLGTFRVRDTSGKVEFAADAQGQVTYTSPRYNQSYYGRF